MSSKSIARLFNDCSKVMLHGFTEYSFDGFSTEDVMQPQSINYCMGGRTTYHDNNNDGRQTTDDGRRTTHDRQRTTDDGRRRRRQRDGRTENIPKPEPIRQTLYFIYIYIYIYIFIYIYIYIYNVYTYIYIYTYT